MFSFFIPLFILWSLKNVEENKCWSSISRKSTDKCSLETVQNKLKYMNLVQALNNESNQEMIPRIQPV